MTDYHAAVRALQLDELGDAVTFLLEQHNSPVPYLQEHTHNLLEI